MSNGSQKSGLPVIAWVGIGCLGIVIVGVIIAAAGGWFLVGKAKEIAEDPTKAVELMVKANPDVDLVENNKEDGTFTVKNNKTGQVVTWNYDDIKNGKFSMTGPGGTTTIDTSNNDDQGITIKSDKDGIIQIGGNANTENLPAWVPDYPNVTSTSSTMTRRQGNVESGAVTLVTSDSADDVAAHYKQAFEGQGFEVTEQSASFGNNIGPKSLSAKAGGRTVQVTVISSAGKTNIVINYQGE